MSADGSEGGDVEYPSHLLTDEAIAHATASPGRGRELAEEEEDDGHHFAAAGGGDSPRKRLKTLRELAEGPNREAALNEIEDKVYTLMTLFNFIALRLVNSSGGRSPYVFSKDTRRYIEKNPRINVQMPDGRSAPFVRDTDNSKTDPADDIHV